MNLKIEIGRFSFVGISHHFPNFFATYCYDSAVDISNTEADGEVIFSKRLNGHGESDAGEVVNIGALR